MVTDACGGGGGSNCSSRNLNLVECRLSKSQLLELSINQITAAKEFDY
jgi:hypothetical protein